MPRKIVRFLTTELFESEGRGKGPLFEEGKEYEFDGPFADRWINREAAVLVRELPDEPFNAEGVQLLIEHAQGLVDRLRNARIALQAAIEG